MSTSNITVDSKESSVDKEIFPKQITRKVAVVIPCYRVSNTILDLIDHIDRNVHRIYIIDDCCPENSGELVKNYCIDPRVKVIFHKKNKGVGGAVKTGFRHALSDGMSIVVKIDGDNQMDPSQIESFIKPIIKRKVDYTKGNRFHSLELLESMPKARLFGNLALSFINKACNGYWNIMDPTNGYFAISAEALKIINIDKIDNSYFFESDMLFRLGINRCVIKDIPLKSTYGNETSGLRINRILTSFPHKLIKRFLKRIFYNYFLRDFNIGTVSLLLSIPLIIFGFTYGVCNWYTSSIHNIATATGTIILSELSIIMGIQFLLFFIQYDMDNIPINSISAEYYNNDKQNGDENESIYNQ